MKFTSAVALVLSAVNAADIKINLWQGNNLPKENLLQSLIQSISLIGVNEVGKVTYTQCDDDAGVFIFDEDSTTNSPDPVIVGQDLNFHLAGLLSDDITVENVHVHVDWNSSPLYDEDHAVGQTYSGDFAYDMAWNVPSYAPKGNYDVTITGTGSTGGSDTEKVMCINAKMEL